MALASSSSTALFSSFDFLQCPLIWSTEDRFKSKDNKFSEDFDLAEDASCPGQFVMHFDVFQLDDQRRTPREGQARDLLAPPPPKRRIPRPLKPEELATLWHLLIERGDARVRFADDLGEDAGLRPSEICRVRISDVDLEAQRVHVRLPNSTMTERDAFIGEKTIQYFHEWMRERDANCGHDYYWEAVRGPSPPAVAGVLIRAFGPCGTARSAQAGSLSSVVCRNGNDRLHRAFDEIPLFAKNSPLTRGRVESDTADGLQVFDLGVEGRCLALPQVKVNVLEHKLCSCVAGVVTLVPFMKSLSRSRICCDDEPIFVVVPSSDPVEMETFLSCAHSIPLSMQYCRT